MCVPHSGVIVAFAEADRATRREAVLAGAAIGAFLLIGIGGAVVMLAVLLT